MKLIDTDILIDLSRGIADAEQFLETLRKNNQLLAISVITNMELIRGCRNKIELKNLLDFLDDFELIHISELISKKASQLIENYHLSHGIEIPDAIIASTDIITDSDLYSRNIKDFGMIRGLKLTRPY